MPDVTEQSAPEVGTREKILEVALDLFIRKGYAETSLREIAAELGITKAALYYHFQAKADILLALHQRVHLLTDGLALAFEGDPTDEAWGRLLDLLLGIALHNRRLVELHLRNQEAIKDLHSGPLLIRHGPNDEAALENRFVAFLADRSTPADLRVRRVATLGMIGSVLLGATALSDVPDGVLEQQLRLLIGEVLGGR
jgi:AcrR family transcriptional regulator